MVNFKERATELCGQIRSEGIYSKDAFILVKSAALNTSFARSYDHGKVDDYDSLLSEYTKTHTEAFNDYHTTKEKVKLLDAELVKEYEEHKDKASWITRRHSLEESLRANKKALQNSFLRLKRASKFLEAFSI